MILWGAWSGEGTENLEDQHRGNDSMRTYDRGFLQEMKKKLDVDLIGVASVDRSTELRDKAAPFLPTVQSVVVFAKETYREVVSLLGPSREAGAPELGEVLSVHSNYIYGRLNRAVHEMAEIFHAEGHRSIPLCAAPGFITDQRYLKALFSYKHAAALAGLGTIGRNSLLITPEFGPRVRLACLLTEAPVEETPRTQEEGCTQCDACIGVCPAQAIHAPESGQPYAMNPFACRAYRQAGLVCSVCLKVCDEIRR
jgi:epoxyqueuosine reductase